ncbi:TRAP-type C4-dicarboxylate transport system permease small subunit [Planomicrobium soli]|uniref:TRAP-type C4-dicarboxylate transport system permease small subunit n=1 Tax=Planomicrobium soli TaxID=1176648 RepID=A0A2P8H3C5_9BACL|nr:TRAP transporter small permease [Planomicrobium soli]PSL40724.1 TRAP-type C4-dicarboxylate transport system permease small subunit [Planomicrobium soli]
MPNIRRVYDLFFSTILTICKIMLALQIIITSYIVFGRYVLNNTPPWGEPAILMLMVWFSFLSSALAFKDNTHIRMSVIDLVLPHRGLKIFKRMYYLLTLAFALFMVKAGYELIQLTSNSMIPGLKISSAWLYSSVMVTGVCILVALFGKARKAV